MRTFRKMYRTFRDNSIVSLFEYLHMHSIAESYGWLTTETIDVIVFALTAKLSITSIETKYIILFVITFLL